MKSPKTHKTTLALTLGLLAGCAALPLAYADGGSSSVGGALHPYQAVESSNTFGYALTQNLVHDALTKDSNQNILLSPSSAAMALQMLLNGAGGVTATEMTKALDLGNLDLAAVNRSNHDLLDYLQGLSGNPVPTDPHGGKWTPFTLSSANSVWGNSAGAYQFKPSFLSVLKDSYQAVARAVNFSTDDGAKTINQWASDETHGKITQVVDPVTLKSQSFVLMNATYFKANWLSPFDPQATRSESFTRGDGSRAPVEMMQADSLEGYAEVQGNQVMELPYAGGTASMYVVLPQEGKSLLASLDDPHGPLNKDFWDEVDQAQASGYQRAQFSMPRFEFKNDLSLNRSLQALGMKTLFTAAADLGAVGNAPVSVSDVKQDTFIHVDETGTEAAAVTSISAGSSFEPQKPVLMTVNRPFLIAIVEKTSKAVLFLGEVSNP